jgi:hypothetical protein
VRPERLEKSNCKFPRYFLLDGQQRITALASVLLKKTSPLETWGALAGTTSRLESR